ncbi:hypothetical protein [Streptomyces sp. NPDC055085]
MLGKKICVCSPAKDSLHEKTGESSVALVELFNGITTVIARGEMAVDVGGY